MRRTLAASLFASVLLLSPLLRAEDAQTVERAKALYSAGAQTYAASQYADALQAFEEAYKLTPRPFILFGMAQAARKAYFSSFDAEQLRKAARYYKQYVADGTGEKTAEAKAALAELGPSLAELEAKEHGSSAPPPPPPVLQKTLLIVSTQVPGVLVSFDGAKPSTAVSLEVTPQKHTVKVTAEGYEDEVRTVEAIEHTTVPIPITMREKPGRLEVSTAPGSEIEIDGRAVGVTPFSAPIDVPAGPHFVAVLKNGKRGFSKEVTLERGKVTRLDAGLETSGQRAAAYVFFGIAGAGAIAGGVFTALAFVQQANAQSISNARAMRNISPGELSSYNSDLDQRDMWRTTAIATFGGSLAVLAAGTILYAFDKPHATASGPLEPSRPREAPRPTDLAVLPIVGPTSVGLALFGRM